MPQYPGGYQIIDLGGIELSTTPTDLPSEKWFYAYQAKKPVYISNFTLRNSYIGPLLLVNEANGQDILVADLPTSRVRVVVNLADLFDGSVNIYIADLE